MDSQAGILACCGLDSVFHLTGLTARQLSERVTYSRQMGRGFILAATAQYQKEAAKVLQKKKFQSLAKFKNPNTGRVVTIWGLNLKPVRKTRKK